jgi:N-methylhydantoinase A
MLMTDVRHDYVRTYYQPLLDADFSELVNIYAELIGSGRATLNDEGVDASAHTYEHTLDLRYVGQEFSVQVPVTELELQAGDAAGIKRRFDEIYDRRFGNAAQDEPLELVNLRLTARGARPKIGFPKLTPGSVDPRIGTRPIYFDDRSRPVEAAVFQRARMAPGTRAQGPAVIEEYGSTTVLFDGDTATITDTGEIVISVGAT